MKDISRDRRYSSRDLNLEPPEYDAVVLHTRPQSSARDKYLQLIFIKLSEKNLV
jgi:hypothetical protein